MVRLPPSYRFGLMAAVIGLAACMDSEAEGDASAPDLESARAEVLAAEDDMNLAVDGLDCRTGTTYMGDAEPIFVSSGNVVRTRSELLGVCEQMVANRTGAVFAIDSRSARMLSNAAALVVREGTYTINLQDGTSREIYLVMSTVWERGPEGWRMVHLHESMRPPTG